MRLCRSSEQADTTPRGKPRGTIPQGVCYARISEPIPCKVGVQVSSGLCSEVPREAVLWFQASADWPDPARPLPPQGDRVGGGSCNAGPCSLGFEYPTEVQCFPHRWVLEGEVGDSDPPTPDGPEQGLYRQALLEHRVFCEYCWPGRADGEGVCSPLGAG